jgi:hypothetical protein
MDLEPMETVPELSVRFVLRAFAYGSLVVLVTFCAALPLGCIYWTWTASRKIVNATRNSWRRLRNSGFGWSKQQKTLLPRSAYTWLRGQS